MKLRELKDYINIKIGDKIKQDGKSYIVGTNKEGKLILIKYPLKRYY